MCPHVSFPFPHPPRVPFSPFFYLLISSIFTLQPYRHVGVVLPPLNTPSPTSSPRRGKLLSTVSLLLLRYSYRRTCHSPHTLPYCSSAEGRISPYSYGKNSLWMALTALEPCSSSTSIEMLVLLAPWLIIFTLTSVSLSA